MILTTRSALLLLAILCFGLATVGVAVPRLNLVAFGLALLAAAQLV